MFDRFSSAASQLDTASLERCAKHAGAAWACSYSSSDEYDAALIAERRAAGVYGPRRQRRQLLVTLAGVGAAVAVLMLLLNAIA